MFLSNNINIDVIIEAGLNSGTIGHNDYSHVNRHVGGVFGSAPKSTFAKRWS